MVSRKWQLLEDRIGHRFANKALLRLALTHRSITNESDETEHNERLEFLGDAILQLCVSRMLFDLYTTDSEGELSRLRATAVNRDALADHARDLELGPMLRMGAGERRSGGANKSNLLADAFEAVIAAIYLDAGLDLARAFVERTLDIPGLKDRATDPKTELQHYCQKTYHKVPVYRVKSETGPEHDRSYHCDVLLGERVLGSGEGKSKKTAEQVAARVALTALQGAIDV